MGLSLSSTVIDAACTYIHLHIEPGATGDYVYVDDIRLERQRGAETILDSSGDSIESKTTGLDSSGNYVGKSTGKRVEVSKTDGRLYFKNASNQEILRIGDDPTSGFDGIVGNVSQGAHCYFTGSASSSFNNAVGSFIGLSGGGPYSYDLQSTTGKISLSDFEVSTLDCTTTGNTQEGIFGSVSIALDNYNRT